MRVRTKVWSSSLIATLVVMAAAITPSHPVDTTAEIAAVSPKAAQAVEPLEPLLGSTADLARPLPADAVGTLITTVATLSAELGFPQDPSLPIRAANLPRDVAGRVANVASDLLTCHRSTSTHLAAIRDRIEAVAIDGGGLDPARFADIRTCAVRLWGSTLALEVALRSFYGASPTAASCTVVGPRSIDVWPVLRFEGTCTDTVYLNDYVLTVDVGGRDTYQNNVGSNMVDVNFSPPGSTVTGVRGPGAAQGCQRAVAGITAGDCVPTAALLLDLAGADTFGVMESPDVDAACTSGRVIRRMVTGGVGFLGVGILRDAGSSNDRYTGKTVSLGAGHVFGVGVLSDNGGKDAYRSIRNSQGFALVSGAGVLRDEGGSDTFDFYLPAGGVIDDQDVCDADLRFLQGAANVGGVGILIEESGNDRYHGAFSADFEGPNDAVTGRAGSQGFGNNGGFGILLDRDGTDSYTIDGDQGEPRRRNGVTIGPDPTCQSSTCSGGVFIDR